MSTGSWYHRVLDGYRVGAHAGVALGGDLYDAERLRGAERALLKIIAPGVLVAPGFQARHERDVALLRSFQHPHVMTLLDAGSADGATYVAMRPLPGPMLAELIVRYGRLDHGRVTELAVQISAALDAAHERGLVHRGLSPGSIVVSERDGLEHATLTDFAVADDPALYGGLFVRPSGTAPPPADYVAPEQVRGDAVDARSDVYALGAILFHALTGRPPFADRPSVSKLEAHLSEPVPSAAELVAGLPRGFDELFARALAKDPADRYGSAGELALALPDRVRVQAALSAMPAASSEAKEPAAAEPSADEPSAAEPAAPASGAPPATGDAAGPEPYVIDEPEDDDADVLGDDEPLAQIDAAAYEDLDEYDEEPGKSSSPSPSAGPRFSRPALIALLLALVAAIGATMVAAGLFERAGEPATSAGATAPPTTTTAEPIDLGEPPPADAGPLPSDDDEAVSGTSGGLSWPAGRSAYTAVIYASDSDRATALQRARRAAALGVPAGVLRSNEFANLEPGVWVTFAGVHEDEAGAQRTAQRMREAGLAPSPYTRFIDPR